MDILIKVNRTILGYFDNSRRGLQSVMVQFLQFLWGGGTFVFNILLYCFHQFQKYS